MTANEIVKRLEKCLSWDACGDCPYSEREKWCANYLMEDALKLLKPRVLSLDEVREMGEKDGEILWLEYRTGGGEWVEPRTMGGFVSYKGFHEVDDVTHCDVRCWTARPSDEQRRAEPWEE